MIIIYTHHCASIIVLHTCYYYHSGLKELAKYPNVYCKVSGMFTADQSCDIQTFVETSAKPCLEIFGINRCTVYSYKCMYIYIVECMCLYLTVTLIRMI